MHNNDKTHKLVMGITQSTHNTKTLERFENEHQILIYIMTSKPMDI